MGSSHFKISGTKPVVAFAAETQDLLGMSLSLNDMHLARTNRLAKLLGVRPLDELLLQGGDLY